MSSKRQTVLGIDLEGMNRDLILSGIDLNTDRVTEVGAVLWDWDFKQPVKMMSELIDEADRLPISYEVQELTGLNDQLLKTYANKGEQIHLVLDRLASLMEEADFIMAHNGDGYDIPMLRAFFKRYGKEMPKKIWIDTLYDIEFPSRIKLKSMAMLEHAHGFLNPFPHRALTDVLTMLKIASEYPLSRMSKLAQSPKVTIVANLNAPNWKNYEDVQVFNRTKHKVSKSRFKWNPSDKTWTKEVHKLLLDEGKIDYDFDWFIQEF